MALLLPGVLSRQARIALLSVLSSILMPNLSPVGPLQDEFVQNQLEEPPLPRVA